jgi:hypothetical protein
MAKHNDHPAKHGGRHAGDNPQPADDIIHLQTMGASTMSFIGAADALLIDAENTGHKPFLAGAQRSFGAHHTTFPGSEGKHGDRSTLVGRPDTFQRDAVGGFPVGWNDVALVDPGAATPIPSAIVVNTMNAFGHPTQALATLPAIAPSHGIYRSIESSDFYSMSADIRIDRFSDVSDTPPACGCPPGSDVDWPIQVGFMHTDPANPFHLWPQLGLFPGATSQTWRLIAITANVVADIDLGVPVTLGRWYGLQLDLDAETATVHSRIADVATGSTLADTVTSLLPFGAWDPAIDGMFDIESFFDGELSAKTTSGLAVIDNVDAPNRHMIAGLDGHRGQDFAGVWSSDG